MDQQTQSAIMSSNYSEVLTLKEKILKINPKDRVFASYLARVFTKALTKLEKVELIKALQESV